jgi:Ca2+-binding RTX toxin-like protein
MNIFKNLSKTKIIALLLLPFVAVGLFNIVSRRNVNVIQAVDPLVVTYNGTAPTDPMFTVTNMLPGDEVEKTFNVDNDTTESVDVEMRFVKTDEDKDFSEILDVEVEEVGGSILFVGKLKDLFDIESISLGTFPAESDKDFRVKVKFPSSAENEYQEALVVFNIIWSTNLPPIELPEECKHLQGKITSVIEGTEGDDRIIGTGANELILAKGGADRVDGKSGDDCIVGGEGNDRKLDGGDGNDIVLGGPGNDYLQGGDNMDILYGGDGDDRIDGGRDKDVIFGGSGNDDIEGGSGDDFIDGGEGDDKIDGESGNDYILGGAGNDEIDGGSGNDEIYGQDGDDTLEGGSGADKLYGESGDDIIKGGSRDDYLDGGVDTDNLDGGGGTDDCTLGETYNSCETII